MIPGWHTTIFPPYFVAGAVFSGFAMVQNVADCSCGRLFKLKHIITLDHLEKMNKVMILTGSMVGYAYAMEFFIAWYSGNQFETFVFLNRALGPYAWAYWTMVSCNVIFPQLFWFKKIRRSIPADVRDRDHRERRDVVRAVRDRRDIPLARLPAVQLGALRSDACMTPGSSSAVSGLFFTLILLFVRVLPVVSISEIKAVVRRRPARAHASLRHGS